MFKVLINNVCYGIFSPVTFRICSETRVISLIKKYVLDSFCFFAQCANAGWLGSQFRGMAAVA